MWRHARIFVLTMLVGSLAVTASAQTSNFEELRFTLAPGADITVTGVDGAAVHGKILQISRDQLTLAGDTGEPRTWPRDRIQRITVKGADSLTNGTFIGAGAGAALAIAPLFGSACDRNPGCGIALIGASMGGAVIGALIDRMHKTDRTMYEGGTLDAAVAATPSGTAFQVRYRW